MTTTLRHGRATHKEKPVVPRKLTKKEAHQMLDQLAKDWKPNLPLTDKHDPGIQRDKLSEFLSLVFQTFGSDRLVKVGRFASEELDHRTFGWRFFDTFRGDYDPFRAEQLGIELRYDTYDEGDRSYLAYINPTRPRVKTLVHDGILWDERKLVPSDIETLRYLAYLHGLIDSGVFGNHDSNTATYLKKADFKPREIFCGSEDGPTIRLIVDTKILLSMRDVYYDPEAAIVEEEFKNTFMVRGGIPFRAIRHFELDPEYFK